MSKIRFKYSVKRNNWLKPNQNLSQRREVIKLSLNKRNIQNINTVLWKAASRNDLSRVSEKWKVNWKGKQEIKKYYGGLTELYLKKVTNLSTNQSPLLCQLERRLDVIVYRLHWSSSIYSAKLLISHGFFSINGKTTYTPSLLLNPGDILHLSSKSSLIKMNVKDYLSRYSRMTQLLRKPSFRGGYSSLKPYLPFLCSIPFFLEVDYSVFSATLLTLPSTLNSYIPKPLSFRYP